MRKVTHSTQRRRRALGFTLIEVLVVVTIIGILAAIVVPRFVSATDEGIASAAASTEFQIRQQIEIYKVQHDGLRPSGDPATFVHQLTLSSNAAGETAAVGTAGYPFGPYIRKMPTNPFTGGSSVGTDATRGSSDWYYDQSSGMFRANHVE